MLPVPREVFTVLAVMTHGLVGLALGAVLFDRPMAGLVGGFFADGDYLFPDALSYPYVHRGITHGLLGLVVVTTVALLIDRRTDGVAWRTGTAVAVAYAAHLGIDVTVSPGVPLFYPVVPEQILLDPGFSGHSPLVTVVLWVGSLGLLFGYYSDDVDVPTLDWG